MLNLNYNWWEASQIFEMIINPPSEVPLTRYGQIYNILFGQNPNKRQYEITIGNFPTYTYLDLVTMISSSLG